MGHPHMMPRAASVGDYNARFASQAFRMVLNIAAYLFVAIDDADALAVRLRERAAAAALRGTMLVTPEGLNLFLAGAEAPLRDFLAWLRADARFAALHAKESWSGTVPFARLKVKRKAEIITFRREAASPLRAGERAPTVAPATLARWIAQGHDDAGRRLVLLDTRNRQEIAHGTFEGALTLPIDRFTDLPAALAPHREALRDATVVSFCTGGIRCEKASSYMLGEGFEEVYHLKGGILKYLEEVPQEQTKWQGDCFVFDNRVTVRHDLSEGDYDQCHACRTPISVEDRQSEFYSPGVSCPHCWDSLPEKTRESARERQKQIELARARNQPHPIGRDPRQLNEA